MNSRNTPQHSAIEMHFGNKLDCQWFVDLNNSTLFKDAQNSHKFMQLSLLNLFNGKKRKCRKRFLI